MLDRRPGGLDTPTAELVAMRCPGAFMGLSCGTSPAFERSYRVISLVSALLMGAASCVFPDVKVRDRSSLDAGVDAAPSDKPDASNQRKATSAVEESGDAGRGDAGARNKPDAAPRRPTMSTAGAPADSSKNQVDDSEADAGMSEMPATKPPVECSDKSACAAAQGCSFGICASECKTDADCSTDQRCQQGACLTACDFAANKGCAVGTCACFAPGRKDGAMACTSAYCIAPRETSTCSAERQNDTVCDGPSGSRLCFDDSQDPDCNAQACATQYTKHTDDYGKLSVEAPMAWLTTRGNGWHTSVFPSLPNPIGLGLNVSPNVSKWFEDFVTPGVFIGVSAVLAESFEPAQVLSRLSFEGCSAADLRDDNIPGASGALIEWTCTDGHRWLTSAYMPEDRTYIVEIQQKVVGPCDREYFAHARSTFSVAPVDEWPAELK